MRINLNNIVTIAGLVILLAFGLQQCHSRDELEHQVRDLQVQLAHATIPLKLDNIRDSVPIATQQAVTVDKTDYKQQAADRQLIKDLNLKVSQIEAENTMLREALGRVPLKPVSPDTVTSGVVTPERDSVFAYHDHWVDFMLDTRHGILDYAVRDSFKTYVDRIPRHKFLWWRWGTKGYEVTIVNFNKNVQVKYNRMIIVKKK